VIAGAVIHISFSGISASNLTQIAAFSIRNSRNLVKKANVYLKNSVRIDLMIYPAE